MRVSRLTTAAHKSTAYLTQGVAWTRALCTCQGASHPLPLPSLHRPPRPPARPEQPAPRDCAKAYRASCLACPAQVHRMHACQVLLRCSAHEDLFLHRWSAQEAAHVLHRSPIHPSPIPMCSPIPLCLHTCTSISSLTKRHTAWSVLHPFSLHLRATKTHATAPPCPQARRHVRCAHTQMRCIQRALSAAGRCCTVPPSNRVSGLRPQDSDWRQLPGAF